MSNKWNRSILARFSRETSSRSFIPEIDGLRCIAVMSVVLFHLDGSQRVFQGQRLHHEISGGPFSVVLREGAIGVQLFFAISGFVVALPFAKHFLLGDARPRLRHYFLRRLTRLEPPYLICLLLCFLLSVLRWGQPFWNSLCHLTASVFYLHLAVYGKPSTLGYFFWSLEVEARFYLVAPLLVLIFAIRPKLLRRIVLMAGIIGIGLLQYRLPGGLDPSDTQRWTLSHQLHYFLAGFLLLDLYLTDWAAHSGSLPMWDLVGILAFVSIPAILILHRGQHVITPLLILLAFAGTLRGKALGVLVRRPIIFVTGGMCYTIYMYQFLVFPPLEKLSMRLIRPTFPWTINEIIQIAILIPPIVAICAAIFLFTEKPFMRKNWPQKLFATRQKKTLSEASTALRINPAIVSTSSSSERLIN